MKRQQVTWDGRTINLAEEAQPGNYGTDGGVRYYAHGVRDDGARVRVAWDDQYPDHRDDGAGNCSVGGCTVNHDDGYNACDWDNPVDVRECE